MQTNYLFQSKRLGFRNWTMQDLDQLTELNSNQLVMKHFPTILNREQTSSFIEKMQSQFEKKGFCYFTVERLDNQNFIGFIGLSEQTFKADFTPCIDIGWRLASNEWNQGFATEGAKRCLAYGFESLNLSTIKSICPVVNTASEKVMKKIGMQKVLNFQHPLLSAYPNLQTCVLYEINYNSFIKS